MLSVVLQTMSEYEGDAAADAPNMPLADVPASAATSAPTPPGPSSAAASLDPGKATAAPTFPSVRDALRSVHLDEAKQRQLQEVLVATLKPLGVEEFTLDTGSKHHEQTLSSLLYRIRTDGSASVAEGEPASGDDPDVAASASGDGRSAAVSAGTTVSCHAIHDPCVIRGQGSICGAVLTGLRSLYKKSRRCSGCCFCHRACQCKQACRRCVKQTGQRLAGMVSERWRDQPEESHSCKAPPGAVAT